MFDASSYDTTMSETPNKNTCQKRFRSYSSNRKCLRLRPSGLVTHVDSRVHTSKNGMEFEGYAEQCTSGVSHCRKLPFSLDNTTQAETHPQIWVIFLLSFYIRILAMNPFAIGSVYFRIVSLLMSFHCHFKAHFSREAHTWQSHKNCQD